MTDANDLGPNACHSCGRPDTVQPDGSVPPHDVLGLSSPCDAPSTIYPSHVVSALMVGREPCTIPGHPTQPAGWCPICHWDGTLYVPPDALPPGGAR